MTSDRTIAIEAGSITIDAEIIAKAFATDIATMRTWMANGALSSLSEAGVGDDLGRHRLSFFHGSKRVRIIVAQDGAVLQTSVIDFGDRPLPAAARRAG